MVTVVGEPEMELFGLESTFAAFAALLRVNPVFLAFAVIIILFGGGMVFQVGVTAVGTTAANEGIAKYAMPTLIGFLILFGAIAAWFFIYIL